MADKDTGLFIDGKPFTKKEFLKALQRTQAGSFLDKERYKQKIERQRSILEKNSKEVIRNIKVNQLSGQKLNKKTGKLQDSYKYRFVKNQYGLTAEIYTDSRLGQMYEDGARGIAIIKTHTEMRNKVFNRVVPTYARLVPQHNRKYNFKALHIMRDGVDTIRSKLLNQLARNIMKD